MKKSGFWNFWFSFVPGCGQLYLGASKKGSILLTTFFATIAISFLTRLEFLLFILPIVWFYSFFDAMNLIHMSEEQLKANDAEFAKSCSSLFAENSLFSKRHVIIGIALLLIGGYMLLVNFMPSFIMDIYWIRDLIYKTPTLFIALAIIVFGIFLLKGKSEKPDFVEYKGGKNDGEQQ